MARPLRIEFDGALYHVTSRGNERKAIFKDDADRRLLLDTLAQVNQRFHWLCHAYCLMDNHYHLVVETPDANLFKGILVQKESHFLEVCRYVVLNPVGAGMVRHPREWLWSSYRATAGQGAVPGCLTVDEVLGQFGRRRAAAEMRYRQF